MPSITLRLTKEQKKHLNRAASESLMTEQNYILNKVFSSKYIDTNRLMVSDIIKKAKREPVGSEFTLPSLFTSEYWNGIDASERRVVSRTFKKFVTDPENTLSKILTYIGKRSNLSVYVRK